MPLSLGDKCKECLLHIHPRSCLLIANTYTSIKYIIDFIAL